jgi:hypothetical protein
MNSPLDRSMRNHEPGVSAVTRSRADEAADEVSRIFQVPAEQRFAEIEDPAKESATSH